MRRLAAPALVVLALLGAGLWAVPRLVDWEAWRERLADVASARLGRPVALEGPIALVLLPTPRVEAGAVAVGDAGDGVTVRARAMRLRLDLTALLALRLEPREIVLVGGEIRLPWPPGALPSFRPPPWLTALDARLEDCRVLVGGLELEKLGASLATGGATEALAAEGSFAWGGRAVRFSGQLGRAGFDGIAPLDLALAVGGATLSTRGVLLPAGGFEGRLEAAGNDLSALVPAPAVPFRASSRFTAAADLLAADDLALDLGGQPARGAVTLRLDPALRLDIALAASRLDLDAWVAALRASMGREGAAGRAVPVSVDLSAEATSLAGVPLRRLRGGAFLQGERLTLSDVSVVLPGGTAVELAGATAGARLEAALQFAGNDLRATLEALGLPVAGTDPARLRSGEGRFRLALQDGEAAFSELVAAVDGARVTGAGVLRSGPRPSIGLGLMFDRLDLDGLLPPDASEWPALVGRAAANLDLNLRLSADLVSWRGTVAERAALDAATEAGRLALRRFAFRLGEVDAVASGNAALGAAPGAAPRFSDISVEMSGADGAALRALVPTFAAELLPLDGYAVALRLTGGGPPEALALRAEAEVGDLRAEAAGTVDAAQRRVSGGTLTARHPGAPRLLAPLLDDAAAGWLGQGSFALIASVNGDGRAINAESFDLVAGEMRLRGGGVSVSLDGPRPRIAGRLAAERLPLPALVAGRGDRPLELRRLASFDAEIALEAARVEAPGLPLLEGASAAVALSGGTLRLDNARARLGNGALRGSLAIEGAAEPPRVSLDAVLEGAAIAGPLFGGLPLDLAAGRADARAELAASGHSATALLATLEGALSFSVRGGILNGYGLGAVQAASALPDLAEAEAALRLALEGGATEFERLEGTARFADGRASLDEAALSTEGGAVASVTGSADPGRGGALDLRLATRPIAEAPEIGVRITGPAAEARRLPEIAPFLRWRAER